MNAIFVGWNRPQPGKELAAQEHFGQFLEYLNKEQKNGGVGSFEPVLVSPHGGYLGGYILIHGDPEKLWKLQGTDDWQNHVARAMVNMLGFGVISAYTGKEVGEQMARYRAHAP
jgi:hypothetical protein